MKEHPIIFISEMVKAILDGRKTQTRRLNGLEEINKQPGRWKLSHNYYNPLEFVFKDTKDNLEKKRIEQQGQKIKFIKSKYQVDDRIWVRENWWDLGFVENGKWHGRCEYNVIKPRYYADCPDPYSAGIGGIIQPQKIKWRNTSPLNSTWRLRPSIHMPKWAARIWLEIINIRIEKLQNISGDDSQKEGWPIDREIFTTINNNFKAKKWFERLWDSINAERGYSWQSNPWIWVIEFKKAAK